jgi:LDH2 family malate/lactate/ureidoglycolate dehydrogenase
MTSEADALRTPLSVLHAFCCDVLQTVGVPADAAALVADSLTQADIRGLSSHGAVRLLPVYVRRLQAGSTRAAPRVRLVRQRGSLALVDGDAGLGQVVGHRAMEIAIEMARELGVGVVGVCHSSHFGTGAFFVEQAVGAGMIGLAMTNAPSNMPPWGARKPYFGTNPLAIGLPCGLERAVVLDMATSVVAKGKLYLMAIDGVTSIPAGWALDADGNPTQDIQAALDGMMLPVGGHKGSGLALVIDALCGVLTGAAFGAHIVNLYDEGQQAQDVGHLFAALDVGVFMPVEGFRARMDRFIREVRAQPRLPGVERIFIPGEIERERAEKNLPRGMSLSEAGRRELDGLAQRLGVTPLTERLG